MRQSGAGRTRYAVLVTISNVAVVEILSAAGYDVVILDCQHGDYSVGDIGLGAALASRAGTELWVRVPVHDLALAQKAIERGARGIVFPMVESPSGAMDAASCCRRQPQGSRSLGGVASFMSGYFHAPPTPDPLCVIQIETASGISASDAILAAPGVDALWIGSVDLANSLGVAAEYGSPVGLDVAQRESRATEEAARSAGLQIVGPPDSAALAGPDVCLVATDLDLVARAASGALRSLQSGSRTTAQE